MSDSESETDWEERNTLRFTGLLTTRNKYQNAYRSIYNQTEDNFLEHIRENASYDFEYTFDDPESDQEEKTCLFTQACDHNKWNLVRYMLPRVETVMWYELVKVYGRVEEVESSTDEASIDPLSELVWQKYIAQNKNSTHLYPSKWRGHFWRKCKDNSGSTGISHEYAPKLFIEEDCSISLLRRIMGIIESKDLENMLTPAMLASIDASSELRYFNYLMDNYDPSLFKLKNEDIFTRFKAELSGHYLRFYPRPLRIMRFLCERINLQDTLFQFDRLILDKMLCQALLLLKDKTRNPIASDSYLQNYIQILLEIGASPCGLELEPQMQVIHDSLVSQEKTTCKKCNGSGHWFLTDLKKIEENRAKKTNTL